MTLALTPLTRQTSRAQGGPPLITDDPATPGNRHWEINVGVTANHSDASTQFETPHADFNYGLGDHIQLKYEVPWVVLQENHGSTRGGLGNSLVGVKWRFVDEEKHGAAFSTYPQIEFNNPTSSADRGLAERGVQFFLPLEIAFLLGPLEVNPEYGYKIVEHGRDEWVYGLAVGHPLRKSLEILGEFHGEAWRVFAHNGLVINVGGRWRLNRTLTLLFTGGRSVRHPAGESPSAFGYLGIQFNY